MDIMLEHETFAKYLNDKFVISIGEAGTVETELVQVAERLLTPHQERFAVVFKGPAAPALRQATYSFTHEGMGTFDLFVVPIAYASDSVLYEAVFNRLTKPTK